MAQAIGGDSNQGATVAGERQADQSQTVEDRRADRHGGYSIPELSGGILVADGDGLFIRTVSQEQDRTGVDHGRQEPFTAGCIPALNRTGTRTDQAATAVAAEKSPGSCLLGWDQHFRSLGLTSVGVPAAQLALF